MRRGRPSEEFRPSLALRWLVLLAMFGWLAIGLYAALLRGMPLYVFLSVGFFVGFFLLFVTYYWRMVYVVDEYGVTYRGATEFEHFPWEDIEQIKDSDLPLGGWYISTKGGGFVLSFFVKERQRLLDTIIARAGLFPR